MKLVREYINEVFKEESDPIHDMGIGIYSIAPKIEKHGVNRSLVLSPHEKKLIHNFFELPLSDVYYIGDEGEFEGFMKEEIKQFTVNNKKQLKIRKLYNNKKELFKGFITEFGKIATLTEASRSDYIYYLGDIQMAYHTKLHERKF